MNTKSLLTRIGVPVLSLGLLGGLGATLATSASASTMATTLSSVKPNSFTVVTHSAQHEDTTNVAVQGRTDNVWAYDNLSEQFKVTPLGGTQYEVQLTTNGSFDASADPTTGQPVSFNGSVHGTYDLGTVTSTQAPDPSALPAQMPDGSGISAAIHALFGPSATYPGGSYDFQYRAAQFKTDQQGDLGNGISVNGTLYEQIG
jgi:hypothetical protein